MRPGRESGFYPRDGCYPTTDATHDLGEGGYAVTLADFEERGL
ncbi:hypothetical protein [Halomicrobium urmianum]|nr:hypothetical protein [Halomicrobium urmianum]